MCRERCRTPSEMRFPGRCVEHVWSTRTFASARSRQWAVQPRHDGPERDSGEEMERRAHVLGARRSDGEVGFVLGEEAKGDLLDHHRHSQPLGDV